MSAKQKQVNNAFEQVIILEREVDGQNVYINELATQVIELQKEVKTLKAENKKLKSKKRETTKANGGSE